MNTRYYVDYENVQAKGLSGLKGLDASDAVMVLYTSHSDRMPLEVLDMAAGCHAKVRTEKVVCGTPSALDFQLATMLGNDIARVGDGVKKFVIVSKDNGYQCLCSYWKEHGGRRVKVTPSIAGGAVEAPKQPENKLAAALVANGLSKREVKTARELISEHKERRKLNQKLCKELGGETASKVFKAMKGVG